MAFVMALSFISFLYFQIFPAFFFRETPTIVSSLVLAVCAFFVLMAAHIAYAIPMSNWAIRHAQMPSLHKPDPPIFRTMPILLVAAAALAGLGALIHAGFSERFARVVDPNARLGYLVAPAVVQYIVQMIASYHLLAQAKRQIWPAGYDEPPD